MKPRKYRHPPQGTTRLIKSDQAIIAKVDRAIAAHKLLTKMDDNDILDLIEALDERDNKTAAELLKVLKKRYGDAWGAIATLVQKSRAH